MLFVPVTVDEIYISFILFMKQSMTFVKLDCNHYLYLLVGNNFVFLLGLFCSYPCFM